MSAIPEFNPLPWDEPEPLDPDATFPLEPDIEYVNGIRVERVVVWKDGATRMLWQCEHGETAPTPEAAVANCIVYCSDMSDTEED